MSANTYIYLCTCKKNSVIAVNRYVSPYKIIDRTSIRGTKKSGLAKKQPVFTIKYKGNHKELVFASEYYEKMNFYKTVEFESRKGFFGFDILENKSLN